MNQELVEILLSIYHIDEISKGGICRSVLECKWAVSCNVCPLGRIHITYGSSPHYLKHLIILKGGMKYEP